MVPPSQQSHFQSSSDQLINVIMPGGIDLGRESIGCHRLHPGRLWCSFYRPTVGKDDWVDRHRTKSAPSVPNTVAFTINIQLATVGFDPVASHTRHVRND